MKSDVAKTSLNAYRELHPVGIAASQLKVLRAMQPGRIYTRRELEVLTGLRTGSVCGRVKELLEGNRLEVEGLKRCAESGNLVEALKLAAVQLELC